MTDRELMQMANRIEALAFEMKAPNAHTPQFVMLANEIRARARLAQPEPDDGYCQACDGDSCTAKEGCVARDNPPPQCEWQGLTDEEIEKLYLGSFDEGQFARAIEAKLKEKNT